MDAGVNKQSNVQKHTLFIVFNGTQKKQLAQYTSVQYRRSVSESGKKVISTRYYKYVCEQVSGVNKRGTCVSRRDQLVTMRASAGQNASPLRRPAAKPVPR